jgi:hypothetical protein
MGPPLSVGFTYFDWASDPDDWNSSASYVSSLGSILSTWACKMQHSLSISLEEAEDSATISASQESF